MTHSPQTPDLNPFEALGGEAEYFIKERNRRPEDVSTANLRVIWELIGRAQGIVLQELRSRGVDPHFKGW